MKSENSRQPSPVLAAILEKLRSGEILAAADIDQLLHLGDEQAALFAAARDVRLHYWGSSVFLYGFLYTSTCCRNNCAFCFYRADSRLSPRFRYRKLSEDIIKAAVHLKESGVHLVDLTMGEDPLLFEGSDNSFQPLLQLVKKVKAASGLPVMVSPGVVPGAVLTQLAQAGASWFACYQESHSPALFKQLRPGQDFQQRLQTKYNAASAGLLAEEGILLGVGEEAADIRRSLLAMAELPVQQVRVMNFVPQPGTPMAHRPTPEPQRELIMIALLRLTFPDRLIPATLDVEGLAGLEKRLNAGANVITSIVPPQLGLAGVAQADLDIDDARRTTAHVLPILEKCGLTSATIDAYTALLKRLQTGETLRKRLPKGDQPCA